MQTIDDKFASATPTAVAAAVAAGSALTVARSDHAHNVGSGTVSLPGLPVGEASTGLYRPGSGQLGAAVLGVNGWTLTSAGLQVAQPIVLTQISSPSAIGASKTQVYSKSDGRLYYQAGASGNESLILDSRKNRVVNGGFSVWQRGTSGPTTTDNAYGPDRWRLLAETTTTGAVISQETSTTPSGGSRYACKLAVGASNNTMSAIFQPIEGVDMWDLRGQVASLQVTLQVSNVRIGSVRFALLQWTGTEDSVSADPINAGGVWPAAGTNPTLTTNWAYAVAPSSATTGAITPTTSYVTYTSENISVSSSATNLGVLIWIDDKTTTAGDYVLITDVQLEKGANCTLYERRPAGQERSLCQQWLRVWGGEGTTDIIAAGQVLTTTLGTAVTALAPSMRAAPTLSVSAAGDWAVQTAGGTITALTVIAIGVATTQAVSISCTVGSAVLAAGNACRLLANTTSSARLYLSSEL